MTEILQFGVLGLGGGSAIALMALGIVLIYRGTGTIDLAHGALAKGDPAFHQGSGRLELADRIFSDAAPLAARVIVNRVWAWHFGRGLVNTPSDFGSQGEKPSHPELLEDLADCAS